MHQTPRRYILTGGPDTLQRSMFGNCGNPFWLPRYVRAHLKRVEAGQTYHGVVQATYLHGTCCWYILVICYLLAFLHDRVQNSIFLNTVTVNNEGRMGGERREEGGEVCSDICPKITPFWPFIGRFTRRILSPLPSPLPPSDPASTLVDQKDHPRVACEGM